MGLDHLHLSGRATKRVALDPHMKSQSGGAWDEYILPEAQQRCRLCGMSQRKTDTDKKADFLGLELDKDRHRLEGKRCGYLITGQELSLQRVGAGLHPGIRLVELPAGVQRVNISA